MAGLDSRLTVGVAAAEITPDRLLELQGYDRRTATGTLDPLEARAIYFDDGQCPIAIVTADIIGLDRSSLDRIRAAAASACDIPGEHVIVCCSHTHSGPAVQDLIDSVVDADYLRWLEAALAGVVVAASQSRRPATLAVGEGQMDFNVNRRLRTTEGTVMRANPGGVVDRRVRVLRIDPADAPAAPGTVGGKPLPQADPIALLYSYVCHMNILGSRNLGYSADYAGASRRFVEMAYRRTDSGGALAAYLPGCFGNVRPWVLAPDGGFRQGTAHEVDVLGRCLGSEVVKTAERVVGEPVDRLAFARRDVELRYASVAGEPELRAARDGRLRFWAETLLARLQRDGRLPASEWVEVAVCRLGHHWLVTLPGEAMLEIGLSIERGLVELGLAQPQRGDVVLALGYGSHDVGYLCTPAAMLEGGYEPAVSWPYYFRPGPFALDTESRLVAAALQAALEIGQG